MNKIYAVFSGLLTVLCFASVIDSTAQIEENNISESAAASPNTIIRRFYGGAQ